MSTMMNCRHRRRSRVSHSSAEEDQNLCRGPLATLSSSLFVLAVLASCIVLTSMKAAAGSSKVRIGMAMAFQQIRHPSTKTVPSNSQSASTLRPSSSLKMFDFFKGNQGEEEEEQKVENRKNVAPASLATATSKNDADDGDPVEKIFNFFFGEKEESPMGMKRFGAERFPEQYPAVVDEFADPVDGDSQDVAALRPLLKNTNLESRKLKLTYDANKHGWNPTAFHQKVDRLGGGLVVCTTSDGLICGGYNPKGWVGYGEARGSIAAFLFVYKRGLTELPSKLRKVGGKSLAQQDLPESGPCFGADSLVIPLDPRDPKQARSKLGSYYERFPDGTNTLFGKRGGSVQLKDLKVYHGVYEDGEYIPFTDAEPFALY